MMLVSNTQADERSGDALEFQVLRDVSDDADINDICCGGRFRFEGQLQRQVQTRYGDTPLWLKVRVPANVGVVQLSPVLDEITLFTKSTEQDDWIRVRTGDMVGSSEKWLTSPFMALPLPAYDTASTVYIRIVQTTVVTIRLSSWPSEDFLTMQAHDIALKVFLLGIVSAMIFYNALVALLIRDVAFLANAITVSSLLILSLYLSGYGTTYVWPQWTGWSNTIQIAALLGSIVFGSYFLWTFVRKDKGLASIPWPFVVAPVLAIVCGVSSILIPYWAAQLWMLLNALAFFLVAGGYIAVSAYRGEAKAKILLFPMIIALLPGLLFVALDKIFGVRFWFFGNNLLEITLCLEAVLFSLALASRIRITEQATRLASERLMALRNETLAKTIGAQDSERQRLAKELHDGVGQDFLVVVGSLKQFVRNGLTENWKSALSELIESATRALDELRRISRDMHPASIQHLGLEKAIESLLESFTSSNTIETEFVGGFEEAGLKPGDTLHIYRIVQECLSNVGKHSGASLCKVSLVQRGSEFDLSIEDDGIGLHADLADSYQTQGLGFVSIGERASALKGRLQISESSLGGLNVGIVFPRSNGM